MHLCCSIAITDVAFNVNLNDTNKLPYLLTCNRDTESVNKQMPATSSSKNEPNLKREAETESKTVKKNGMMTTSNTEFFYPKAKHEVIDHLLNACFVVLLMETKV